MARTLDKNKPYGIVCGGEASYEQDGCLFDLDGELIGDEPEEPKQRRQRSKPEPEPVKDEIQAQIDANLQG